MIRSAVLSDAEALGELQLSCWHEAYGGYAPPGTLDAVTVDRRIKVWNGLLERGMDILVLAVDGVLDGFAATGPARDEDMGNDTGELYALYLRAACQGVGLGRKLHDRALARLVHDGFQAAVLWTIEMNAPARAFYAAAGWSVDDRVPPDPMQWGLDEVRYRRVLP